MISKTTDLYTQKRLEGWKESLWAMWEEGFKLSPRNINLSSMKAMFMTGFDAGRSSFLVVPEARKKAVKRKKR